MWVFPVLLRLPSSTEDGRQTAVGSSPGSPLGSTNSCHIWVIMAVFLTSRRSQPQCVFFFFPVYLPNLPKDRIHWDVSLSLSLFDHPDFQFLTMKFIKKGLPASCPRFSFFVRPFFAASQSVRTSCSKLFGGLFAPKLHMDRNCVQTLATSTSRLRSTSRPYIGLICRTMRPPVLEGTYKASWLIRPLGPLLALVPEPENSPPGRLSDRVHVDLRRKPARLDDSSKFGAAS